MSDVVSAPPQPCHSARSRAFTREVWLERLSRFPTSGLTAAQFCAIEAISLPSFYSWRRRLAAEASASADADASVDQQPRLLPVALHQPAQTVELVLPTGAVLRLLPGCDLAWLRSLVAALGELSC
jgi:hypothetical protein